MEIAFLVLRILLAAAIYAFLGWALWLLWSSLKQQAVKGSAATIPELTLLVDLGEPQTYRFSRGEVVIGRQPGCELRLQEGTISARHARLSFHDAQWWAEDLHSRNGTFVNEERLTAPVVLARADVLRCGSVKLVVEIQPRVDFPGRE